VVPNPRTGRPETQRVTFDHVLAGLQWMLYTPELQSLLPEVIARTAAGDFGPLYAVASLGAADPGAQVNSALHYSVNCADDAARPASSAGAAKLASLPTRSLAGRVLAVCAAWPRGTTPADAVRPLSSDIPVLLLSGGLDPVTPPAYGDEVAKTLPRARHVVARGYGHIVSPHACGPRLLAAFIDDPDTARLPASCIGHFEASVRPPLWPDGLSGAP
jgi:pimeloyl-ACP methyl ester carboxylesterase